MSWLGMEREGKNWERGKYGYHGMTQGIPVVIALLGVCVWRWLLTECTQKPNAYRGTERHAEPNAYIHTQRHRIKCTHTHRPTEPNEHRYTYRPKCTHMYTDVYRRESLNKIHQFYQCEYPGSGTILTFQNISAG